MALIEKPDETRARVLEKQIEQAIREDKTSAIARHLAELVIAMENAQRTLAVHEHSLRLLELPIVRDLAATAPRLRVVDVTAEASLGHVDGFHGLEYAGERTPFRWTGPLPRFQFVVNVDRSCEQRGELLFLASPQASVRDVVDRLEVSIDGGKVPLAHEEADGFTKVSFTIPPRSGAAATTIVCDQPLWSPSDFGSDDGRKLGAQFHRLRILEVRTGDA